MGLRWCSLLLVGACYRGAVDDSCKIRCTDSCPSGLSCVAGYCTSGAVCANAPDAAVGSADAAGDAPGASDAASDAMTDAPSLPPTFVQRAETATYGSTLALTYALDQQAGDLNVVVIAYASGATITSVTDSRANTYAVAAAPLSSGAGVQAIYYARNITASTAGTNTVTISFSASNGVVFRIVEYSGVSATSLAEAAAMGTGTAVDSGPLAVPFGPALLVAADQLVYASAASDPAYTLRSEYYGNVIEDRVVAEAGTYSATDTQDTSAGWVMQLVAFSVQ